MLRPIHDQDLVGSYQANLPDGAVELLELKPNGECVQEIRLNDGTAYRVRGQWWYNEGLRFLSLKGTRVALTPTLKLNPNVSQIPAGITGALPVSRTLKGDVIIGLIIGVDYRRQG